MKRIGNFLFVEQWFADANPKQAVISISTIADICAENVCNNEHTIVELTNDTKVALTGNHDDNIIELAELLEKPITVNQTLETVNDINLTFDDYDEEVFKEEDNL